MFLRLKLYVVFLLAKIAEKIAHKRVFLTFLSLILIQTFALAQNDSKITIQQKNITVIDALKTVEKQSKKSINYSDSELKGKVIAQLNLQNASLETALDTILKGTGFSFQIQGNYIIIAEKKPVVAQTLKNIKGKVTDESGEPLIGVNISVDGSSTGTITDFNGNFSIDLPAGRKELVISYIGYKEQTVTVTGNGPVNVKMVSDTQALDEVVVVGYGTMKKRDLTGAITSVKSEDVVMNPSSNPMQALQGKVAGLDITRESGQAGSGVKMQLRGNRSFQKDSGNPLFIIDGMPGDYSTLNPNDIESIEVLKDASSTAIYGSSGANGVILITTKGGKEGKAIVNFNAYVGVNGWSRTPEMRSGESYIQTLRDASVGAGDGRWSSVADDKNLFTTDAEWNAHQNGQYIDLSLIHI